MRLSHDAEQSSSLALVHPSGQQPSLSAQLPIAVELQVTLQPVPVSMSAVHELPSLHIVGHEPGPLAIAVSQVSPALT